jgi:hypothetical protein
MNRPFPAFDRTRLRLHPLSERACDLAGDFILPLREPETPAPEAVVNVARAIRNARDSGRNVLFFCGGHVIRAGVQRFLLDLMERGFITGLAGNGAVAIHDYEIALQCATTESVARYLAEGRFGLWEETGRINDIINAGAIEGLGFGEALGREIEQGDYAHKDKSLSAAAWRLGLPFTVHVSIGCDIIHEHANFDGAATGAASYKDFLIFTQMVTGLEGGVICTFGSAVTAPEVFLKALAMARNVAMQEGKSLSRFTSLVCDLQDIPANASHEASKSDPRYYFRPWKTLLSRTVAAGGKSYYVRGGHSETIPWLWAELTAGK